MAAFLYPAEGPGLPWITCPLIFRVKLRAVSTSPASAEVSSSTPILDRQLPAPPAMEPSVTHRRASIAILVLAFLVAILWLPLMDSPEFSRWAYQHAGPVARFLDNAFARNSSGMSGLSLMWLFYSPFLALLAVVAMHELGHVVAGKFTGFRVLSVCVGPVEIIPPFHLKWSQQDRLPGAAGGAALVPLHNHSLRPRAIIMFLGGPAANLGTGFALAFLLPSHGLFSAWFIFFSVVLGVVNLVPFRERALHSDGQRILMLVRNSRLGERWLALLQLFTDIRNGVEADHLRVDFIATATAVQNDSSDTVSAHAIAYSLAYHRHDDEEAARLLEVCLKYSGFASPLIREVVFSDAVTFQARRRKRADLAEQWLGELPEETIIPERRPKAEAAILEAKGDVAGALKKLDEAEAIVLRSAEPRRELSLKYLRGWRDELQQQPLAADLR